jgi:hypothetical protein
MTSPEKTFAKIEAQAVRAALHSVLAACLAELHPSDADPKALLAFLSELALALLRYRRGTAAARRVLLRIVAQPAPTDAKFLRALIHHYLQGPPPTSPAVH